MMRLKYFTVLLILACLAAEFSAAAHAAEPAEANMLTLHTRHRDLDKQGNVRVVEKTVEWDPRQTAIIICDMWDDHWCQGAAARVGELAGPMNALVATAREQGVTIIHAPSSVVDFYQDAPQRRRVVAAPFAKTPVPLSQDVRWGTTWCWPDPKIEPDLPIDDSDMGCDCRPTCKLNDPWKRQIAAIEIAEEDYITDHGQETYNVLTDRKIENVILVGVHLNMCVLGRPFGIRQMVNVGKQVVLMRDMTDSMYNSRKRPFVDHFEGTDLVVQHVEQFWCPSIESSDIIKQPPFRFAEDRRGKK